MSTLKKKVHDALLASAQGGSFLAATYDVETSELLEGAAILAASVEVNEISSVYAVEHRYGRKYLEDFSQWQWELILRFNQEAICEQWVRSLLEDPPCLTREGSEDRQVRLLLIDATYQHPPRQGASNGTVAKFRFNAKLSPR